MSTFNALTISETRKRVLIHREDIYTQPFFNIFFLISFKNKLTTETVIFKTYVYLSLRWTEVKFAVIEVVIISVDDVRYVEAVEDGKQSPSVPVVCHTTSIVTLSGQVTNSIKLYFLLTK